MGPGTHIVNNILSGVKPTSYNDALALRHDLDYLTSGEKFGSDFRAIRDSDYSVQGLAMKAGLILRSVGDLATHAIPNVPNLHLNNNEDNSVPLYLVEHLRKMAQPLLSPYGLKP